MQTKASLLLLLLIVFISSVAQKKEPIYKITYTKNYNGNAITTNPIITYATSKASIITNEAIENNTASVPFEKMVYNSVTNALTKVSTLSKNNHISTIDSTSLKKYEFTITDEFKTILGYKCQKATTVINSNHIDIWFTNDIAVKSAPSPLGITLGLVLETNRNNNYIISASKVEKIKGVFPTIQDDVKTYDGLTYNDLIWKSKFKTISVFENEIINFSKESISNDSILRFANGTIILKKIKFPEIKNRDQVLIDLTLQSNGDAYDRTGSVFLIPQDKKTSFFDGLQNGTKTLPIYTNGNGKEYQGIVSTENYNPLIELMRFFTPFGIHQYNYISLKDKEWFDKALYRQDISDLNTYLSNNEYWIGTFIGNYDKGGHKVSVNITIHNQEGNEKSEKLIMPLFNTTNIMEMAGQNYGSLFDNENGLIVEFTLDKAIKNAQLKYITTGHGGWENGDEFVPKENTFILNGNIIHAFTPWRQDCGSYRLYNPASGNFNNGLSSSDYSRSNWCPGTVTNPTYINLGDLPAGKHTLQIKIPQGKPEGNSFSFWNISGLLIGE
jgi:GLPGLI family protein